MTNYVITATERRARREHVFSNSWFPEWWGDRPRDGRGSARGEATQGRGTSRSVPKKK
jgi:hypothetical protein